MGTRLRGLEPGARCEVIADQGGVAAHLAAGLQAAGVDAAVVDAASGEAAAVIFLPALDPGLDPDAQIACQRRAFEAAIAVAGRLQAEPGAFVTVQDTGGDLGSTGRAPERAWLGGLPGLIKTAGLEWPLAGVKAIDLEVGGQPPEAAAARLLAELLTGGPEQEVALDAAGARRTLAAAREPAPDPVRSLGPEDVILVSGGARGVTASCVVAMAQATRARFVLLGRTALADEPPALRGVQGEAALKRALMEDAQRQGKRPSPRELGQQVSRVLADREVRQTLADIQAAGGQVRYAAADVRDRQALAAEIAAARDAWGPITGLLHGAGVLADAWLHKKTPEHFERVFGTKVDGLRALLEATADQPLQTILLFSSVAGRTGNVGQSDYAMANETLNKLAAAEAARRADAGCGVASLGWGPWAGGMVTPALKAHFESQGVDLIDISAGANACVREAQAAGAGPAEIVLGGGVGAQGLHLGLPEGGAAWTLRVRGDDAPWLRDHQIQGRAVLPVVQVIEWFARLACALRPGAPLESLRDLKVLRGVFLDALDAEGEPLTLRAAPATGDDLALTLEDPRGARRFSARACFGPPTPRLEPLAAPLDAEERTTADLYAPGALFHGPAFQAIQALEGVGTGGAAATLVGAADLGWPRAGASVSDSARLDGALQVALLGGLRWVGGQTLPLGIQACRLLKPPAPGAGRCELLLRRADKQRSVTDARLMDEHGAVIAELEGVEMFYVPSHADRG